ncbi:MAG: glycosyltransferase family 4 protein [Oscillospiraceae bacterium]|nr:glycosyltransferase family 4 protein [Oscillospiraceae bacterium]
MKKAAFVIPWFADDIPGGAEMETREVTRHLHEAGIEVEILTTCVKEFVSDWSENFYPEGTEIIKGVPVRRFKAAKRDKDAFDRVNIKLMNGIMPSAAEEEIFINEMVNSPELYRYIREHREEYSAFFFIPYMFGTTYFGVKACPEKAVMIPCFHNEAYVYMKIFREMYSKVRGMLFNARPEYELAEKVYSLEGVKTVVMGTGVADEITSEPDRFREKFKIKEPFIIYAGRKDSGKNVHTLLKYFGEYKKRRPGDLKLILIGGGEIDIPESAAKDTIDLGFVDKQDKYDAAAACEFLCQPSKNESFSLVIMESWLCGRPVLVHRDCAVTANFARESGGGLYFGDYFEFEGCADYFLENRQTAARMGRDGGRYVRENFAWNVIVEKYRKFLEEMEEEDKTDNGRL